MAQIICRDCNLISIVKIESSLYCDKCEFKRISKELNEFIKFHKKEAKKILNSHNTNGDKK